MGTYHTFFVAKEDELDRLFPGWKGVKSPLNPQKVIKDAVNPFTKQKITVRAWEPTWKPVEPPTPLRKPSLYDDVWGPPAAPVIDVENDYMAHIERAGAPGLRALPHFRAKNYDPFLSLEPLAAAIVGSEVFVPPARVGCEGDDDAPTVDALPEAVTKALATMDDSLLPAVMDKVLAADIVDSEQRSEEARTYFVDRALRPLKALALEAERRGARLCHYYALHY